jgi:hypothetical protein
MFAPTLLSLSYFFILAVSKPAPLELRAASSIKQSTHSASPFAGEQTSDVFPNPSATTANLDGFFPDASDVGFPGELFRIKRVCNIQCSLG